MSEGDITDLTGLQIPDKPSIYRVGPTARFVLFQIRDANAGGSYPERIQIKSDSHDSSPPVKMGTITSLYRKKLIKLHEIEIGYGMRWELTDKAREFLKKLEAWVDEWEGKWQLRGKARKSLKKKRRGRKK